MLKLLLLILALAYLSLVHWSAYNGRTITWNLLKLWFGRNKSSAKDRLRRKVGLFLLVALVSLGSALDLRAEVAQAVRNPAAGSTDAEKRLPANQTPVVVVDWANLMATASITATPSYTRTPTYTFTPSFTGTASPNVWASYTRTPTYTPTPTYTNTITSTDTPGSMKIKQTDTPSYTPTPSYTATPTFTGTLTPNNLSSLTPTPTYTVTFTHSHTPVGGVANVREEKRVIVAGDRPTEVSYLFPVNATPTNVVQAVNTPGYAWQLECDCNNIGIVAGAINYASASVTYVYNFPVNVPRHINPLFMSGGPVTIFPANNAGATIRTNCLGTRKRIGF